MSKKVSLVLGSGGARGLAHVGVIRWLEEHGYTIESISGCSMGALIGGYYAAGKLDAYIEWLSSSDMLDLIKLLDIKGSGGVVSGRHLMKKLENLMDGDKQIEDLNIKFTAVTTDIDAQKEIWFSSGSLIHAIRASISIPLFFTPYEYEGMLLVDGGVLNPVPIAPTFNDMTDLTIAVNLGGDRVGEGYIINQVVDRSLGGRVKEYFSKFTLPDAISMENGMYTIANKSFETMQESIARMKLATYPPDIEIDIPKNLCATFDFNKSEKIIEFGYNECAKIFKDRKL